MQSDYKVPANLTSYTLPKISEMFLAMNSMNSGYTEPSVTVPYMFWANLTDNRLYIRDSRNKGWVGLGELGTSTVLVGKNIDGGSIAPNSIDVGSIYPGTAGQIIGESNGEAVWVTPVNNKIARVQTPTGSSAVQFYYITENSIAACFGPIVGGGTLDYLKPDGISSGSVINSTYLIYLSDDPVETYRIYPTMSRLYCIDTDQTVWRSSTSAPILVKQGGIDEESIINIFAVDDPSTKEINVFFVGTDFIYVYGENRLGYLGTGNTDAVSTPVKITESIIDLYKNYAKILTIDMDTTGSYLVIEDSIYQCNEATSYLFELRHSFGTTIKKYVRNFAGGEYVLLQSGVLYVRGVNANGSFGLGDTDNRDDYTLVDGYLFNDIEVINVNNQVSIFGSSKEGILYAWGGNAYSQLSIGGTTLQTTPAEVMYQGLDGTLYPLTNVDRLYSTGRYAALDPYYNYFVVAKTYSNRIFISNNFSGSYFSEKYLSTSETDLIRDIQVSIHKFPTAEIAGTYKQHMRCSILMLSGELFMMGMNYFNSLGLGLEAANWITEFNRIDTID